MATLFFSDSSSKSLLGCEVHKSLEQKRSGHVHGPCHVPGWSSSPQLSFGHLVTLGDAQTPKPDVFCSFGSFLDQSLIIMVIMVIFQYVFLIESS